MTRTNESLPTGFRYSGCGCGIKASGKPDLSLIVADKPVVAAGVYTQNQIVAAPVRLCQSRTPSDCVRAVVTNSGNANACTGDQGMFDANAMCHEVAQRVGCEPENVLVMSTGVIGHLLPMDKIRTGIATAYQRLDRSFESFADAAEAICTTDNARKTVSRTIEIDGREIRIAAMAKGAGMIAPNMATMLAVMVTDAPLTADSANQVLVNAAGESFNRISVDGHTSTNDTLLLLSSGQGEPLQDRKLDEFQSHVNELSIELAKKLVADGEGAVHVMAIRVLGAADTAAAEEIAKTIAASPLVKTAITAGDPNWGRIVSATGYAAAKIDPSKTCLRICDELIYENGTPTGFNAGSLTRKMKSQVEVPIEIIVGVGPGQANYWSSDLTCDYVRFNSEYTT